MISYLRVLLSGALVYAGVWLVPGTSSVFAATIPLGNFVGPTLTYANVTVDDDGAPVTTINWGTPAFTGTGLDFDPTNFMSGSNGGGLPIVIDPPITFELIAAPGVAITGLSFFLSGPFAFSGVGTFLTEVVGEGVTSITLEEVDGVPIAPFALFSPNGSVGFNLLSNPGVAQPWSLGLGADIQAQLDLNLIPYTMGATKLTVSFVPSLTATSQLNSFALIRAADVTIDAKTVGRPAPPIPEPSTIGLAAIGVIALAAVRRFRGNHPRINQRGRHV